MPPAPVPLPARGPVPESRRGRGALPAVREATPEDRRWLESYLRRRGEMVRLLSEDLCADPGPEAVLGERFRGAGLHRERRMFVVDGKDGRSRWRSRTRPRRA